MCMEMQENLPYVITCIGFYHIEIYFSTSFYAGIKSTYFLMKRGVVFDFQEIISFFIRDIR